jgi:hypothetical protein
MDYSCVDLANTAMLMTINRGSSFRQSRGGGRTEYVVAADGFDAVGAQGVTISGARKNGDQVAIRGQGSGIELGAGLTKGKNAGKIAYDLDGSNALEIFGYSPKGEEGRITLHANGGLQVNNEGGARFVGPVDMAKGASVKGNIQAAGDITSQGTVSAKRIVSSEGMQFDGTVNAQKINTTEGANFGGGLVVQGERQTPHGSNLRIQGEHSGVEFGYGLRNKDENSAKIGYQLHTNEGLDIVGGKTKGSKGNGQISMHGDVTVVGNSKVAFKGKDGPYLSGDTQGGKTRILTMANDVHQVTSDGQPAKYFTGELHAKKVVTDELDIPEKGCGYHYSACIGAQDVDGNADGTDSTSGNVNMLESALMNPAMEARCPEDHYMKSSKYQVCTKNDAPCAQWNYGECKNWTRYCKKWNKQCHGILDFGRWCERTTCKEYYPPECTEYQCEKRVASGMKARALCCKR